MNAPVVRLRVLPSVPPQEAELRATSTHLQWRLSGSNLWHDLIAIDDITGSPGVPVEIRYDDGYVQWNYENSTDPWVTLFDTRDFATAEQGSKADTAVQPDQLGSAAYTTAESFATSSQGTKADSALQPADIGDTVQSHGAFLDALAGMTPGSDGQVIAFDSNGDPVATDAGAGDMLEVVYDPDANEANAFDLSNQYGSKPTDFATVADLLADASLGYSAARRADQVAPGQIITAQGFRYE